jgi:hypothetical protein
MGIYLLQYECASEVLEEIKNANIEGGCNKTSTFYLFDWIIKDSSQLVPG